LIRAYSSIRVTDRTDRQTDRLDRTDRQTDRPDRTDRQTDRQRGWARS
jgi:hypothetical protein